MIFDQVSAVTSPIVTAVVLKKARRLLLDEYGGANAAYSLRELSTAWKDQDVVEVRRASDDTTRGFTAAEVAESTMVDWVNDVTPTYEDDFGNNTTGWSQVRGTLTANDSPDASVAASFAPDTDTVNHYTRLTTSNVNTTDTYVTEFDLYIPAGQAFNGVGIKDWIGVDIYSKTLSAGEFGTWVSISFSSQYAAYGQPSIYATFNGSTTLTGDDTEKFYVRNFKVTIPQQGYVSKWYDQSGNDNHAVQATPASQPKIVDAGSLVEDGNLNGSTIWDGVDDDLNPQNGFAGVTSANVYAVTDNAGVVTIDTLTAQDISAKTDLSSVLTGLTYGKVTATIIYPDATNQSGIETTMSGLFET
jgi:hypothetical protein